MYFAESYNHTKSERKREKKAIGITVQKRTFAKGDLVPPK